MSIVSLEFLLFFGISIIVYYAAPKRMQWLSLLVFSIIFFYSSSGWHGILYITANILATDCAARKISACNLRDDGKGAGRWLLFGIAVDAGILAWMKYLDFFIYNWNIIVRALGKDFYLQETARVSPIGISFYTLTSIGYILDVYWQSETTLDNPLKTALFVMYFPQLTSGPITRMNEVRESLFSGKTFEYERVTRGIQRMMWGFFKKLVISSRAAVLVDVIYANRDAYVGLYVWIAASLFMLQLYTDFSGCMDIIIGASEVYGISLPENFRTPFSSQSVQEFWQRWHITLGGWMKVYIMYPILRTGTWQAMGGTLKKRFGKKTAKRVPAYLGMLCVWLLVGLWHGGAWKYVLGMGLWFWSCIVLSDLTHPYFKKLWKRLQVDTDNFGWRLLSSVRVFFLIAIGDMFFRLEGVTETIREIRNGFIVFNPWILWDKKSFVSMGLSFQDQNVLIVSIAALIFVSAFEERWGSVRDWIKKQFIVFRWMIWLGLLFAIIIYGKYGTGYDAADFIYRGF